MACKTLTEYSRQCGRNAKTGINPDVYLIAFEDLTNIVGTTEVFTESVTGLITAIGTGAVKFVKYGTVLSQAGLTEDFTANDNGTYDIAKGITFGIGGIGHVDGRRAVEDLIGLPVAALLKLNSGVWITAGLNGQFQLKTSAGTVDAASNGRVLTLSGSDSFLYQAVDPTIVAALLAPAA